MSRHDALEVVIIDSGGANLASLQFALERLGARTHVVTVMRARLRPRHASSCRASARPAQPCSVCALPVSTDTLTAADSSRCWASAWACSCCSSTSSEGDTACLGVLPDSVRRLQVRTRSARAAHGLESPRARCDRIRCSRVWPPNDYLYFVHSYAAPVSGATLASARYGIELAAVVRQGNFCGTQFHPERSAQAGARLLANFLRLELMLLIPAIDLRGGRCVRLYQGDFAAETRYDLEPHAAAAALPRARRKLAPRGRSRWREGRHARSIAPSFSRSPRSTDLRFRWAAACAVSTRSRICSRAACSGVVIGSAAVEHPQEVLGWLARFGPERICLAFDVRLDDEGIPRVRTHGWKRGSVLSLWQALEPFRGRGLRHVLCTDIERDGALTGPNVALYRQAMRAVLSSRGRPPAEYAMPLTYTRSSRRALRRRSAARRCSKNA